MRPPETDAECLAMLPDSFREAARVALNHPCETSRDVLRRALVELSAVHIWQKLTDGETIAHQQQTIIQLRAELKRNNHSA